ncbi:MAG: DNA adenine methylase [Planctomycetota bacterium]|jgi:DNA adenine methylase|nr:DNA adenine methylase [Planctomycetota bacterium]
MPTTPSPLRYPGGKASYTGMLRQIINDNDLPGCHYIEPFAGGAGAAIGLLLAGDVARIWLNDLDYSIYAFWKAILEHTDEFIAMVGSRRISMAEWRRQREIFKGNDKDILSRGFAAFFLNRCNRAGILAANPIGGLRQAGDYRMNARFKKKPLIEKIRAISGQKARITVTNLDAIELLRRYLPKIGKTLVYFDPPYHQKGGLLYLNHYTPRDHRRLSAAIRQCACPWLLSYDDRPEILRLYRGVHIYRRNLRYSVTTPSVGTELIVSGLRMPKNLERVA